jgi:hypothetical protein
MGKRGWISVKKRHAIYERDDWTCVYCSYNLRDGSPTLDHLDPNGGNDPKNLVCCCKDCNRKKSDTHLDDYLKCIDEEEAKEISQIIKKNIAKRLPKVDFVYPSSEEIREIMDCLDIDEGDTEIIRTIHKLMSPKMPVVRLTYRDIAKKSGFAHTTLSRRLKKLSLNGVIGIEDTRRKAGIYFPEALIDVLRHRYIYNTDDQNTGSNVTQVPDSNTDTSFQNFGPKSDLSHGIIVDYSGKLISMNAALMPSPASKSKLDKNALNALDLKIGEVYPYLKARQKDAIHHAANQIEKHRLTKEKLNKLASQLLHIRSKFPNIVEYFKYVEHTATISVNHEEQERLAKDLILKVYEKSYPRSLDKLATRIDILCQSFLQEEAVRLSTIAFKNLDACGQINHLMKIGLLSLEETFTDKETERLQAISHEDHVVQRKPKQAHIDSLTHADAIRYFQALKLGLIKDQNIGDPDLIFQG